MDKGRYSSGCSMADVITRRRKENSTYTDIQISAIENKERHQCLDAGEKFGDKKSCSKTRPPWVADTSRKGISLHFYLHG